jgi:SAM-dependent methyltransferase
VAGAVDWGEWLRRWDAQQTLYLPDRESRFDAMLDVLQAVSPERFVALDLACGPGSLSQRLLRRFPEAKSVAVDLDPVLLAMGRAVLGDLGGRLDWIEADLRDPAWGDRLREHELDAVLTTTALHWLAPDDLRVVYARLGRLVRPGGVLLNGDHLAFPAHLSTLQRVARAVKDRRLEEARARPGAEDWDQWWASLEVEPALRELIAERKRRFAWRRKSDAPPPLELHERALRDAGFGEVGVIWQNMENRVLMAVR